ISIGSRSVDRAEVYLRLLKSSRFWSFGVSCYQSPLRIFPRRTYRCGLAQTKKNNWPTVDNFIMLLRRKIEEDPAHAVYLQTVRGTEYKFVAFGWAEKAGETGVGDVLRMDGQC